MKKQLQIILINILILIPFLSFAQAPNLGKANQFVLFTANGPISNTGISRITGDVGTNNGSSTAFGNVNGVMHDGDSVSITAAADLLVAYNFLDSRIPTFFPSPLLGNGDTLIAGIYSVSAASTLNENLILDAQGDANALFIIQIEGPLASASGAKVKLINNALACNVFWKVEGMVSLASNTTICGTIIANNAASSSMTIGVELIGRILITSGALTTNAVRVEPAFISSNCTSTGIFQTPENIDVASVSPNPFNSFLNIKLKDDSQVNNYSVVIFNSLGQVIYTSSILDSLISINTEEFKSGVYYYQILKNNINVQSGKLIAGK